MLNLTKPSFICFKFLLYFLNIFKTSKIKSLNILLYRCCLIPPERPKFCKIVGEFNKGGFYFIRF